jgi:valyl-tRNA synthetase
VPAADPARETESLEKRRRDLEAYLRREEGKLGNPSFAERAPADVVAGARKRVEDARAQLRAVEEEIRRLRGGA